jgi:hypothetical protein
MWPIQLAFRFLPMNLTQIVYCFFTRHWKLKGTKDWSGISWYHVPWKSARDLNVLKEISRG